MSILNEKKIFFFQLFKQAKRFMRVLKVKVYACRRQCLRWATGSQAEAI